jgi:hypothetical protein
LADHSFLKDSTSSLALLLVIDVTNQIINQITMKKLILIAACVGFFAATSFAQVDTTKSKTGQSSSQPTQSQPSQSDRMKNDDMKGWTRVQQSDLPEPVRTTLGGSQYTGWESGTIHRNQAGDVYSVRVKDATGNGNKVYYFDKNGKAVSKPRD